MLANEKPYDEEELWDLYCALEQEISSVDQLLWGLGFLIKGSEVVASLKRIINTTSLNTLTT